MRSDKHAPARAALICAVIVSGLALDQRVEFWGQTLVNLAVWLLLACWLKHAEPAEQRRLVACVVYATLGEAFLSLTWGLYEYRLGNLPLFVPPGHALLFALGGMLAARARAWIIWFVPLAAAPCVLFLAWSGTDTLGIPLFGMFLACLICGRAKKLYAVMFVLALAMEVYGTWLGNWVWKGSVPWLGLATLNPPLAAGAFYCVLDLLIVSTTSRPATSTDSGPIAVVRRFFPALCRAATPAAQRARTAAGI